MSIGCPDSSRREYYSIIRSRFAKAKTSALIRLADEPADRTRRRSGLSGLREAGTGPRRTQSGPLGARRHLSKKNDDLHPRDTTTKKKALAPSLDWPRSSPIGPAEGAG